MRLSWTACIILFHHVYGSIYIRWNVHFVCCYKLFRRIEQNRIISFVFVDRCLFFNQGIQRLRLIYSPQRDKCKLGELINTGTDSVINRKSETCMFLEKCNKLVLKDWWNLGVLVTTSEKDSKNFTILQNSKNRYFTFFCRNTLRRLLEDIFPG